MPPRLLRIASSLRRVFGPTSPAIALPPRPSVQPRRLSRFCSPLRAPLPTLAASVRAPAQDPNSSEPARSPALQELLALPPIPHANGEARSDCPARATTQLCCATASKPPLQIARSPRPRFLPISPAIA